MCPSLVSLELSSSWSLGLNIASCYARGRESPTGSLPVCDTSLSTYNLLTRTSHMVQAIVKDPGNTDLLCAWKERELEMVSDTNIY